MFTVTLTLVVFALFNALSCSAVTLITTITQNACSTSRDATAASQSPPKSSSTSTAHPVSSPAEHWDQDLGDLTQLLLSTSGQLYYSEGGTGGRISQRGNLYKCVLITQILLLPPWLRICKSITPFHPSSSNIRL